MCVNPVNPQLIAQEGDLMMTRVTGACSYIAKTLGEISAD